MEIITEFIGQKEAGDMVVNWVEAWHDYQSHKELEPKAYYQKEFRTFVKSRYRTETIPRYQRMVKEFGAIECMGEVAYSAKVRGKAHKEFWKKLIEEYQAWDGGCESCYEAYRDLIKMKSRVFKRMLEIWQKRFAAGEKESSGEVRGSAAVAVYQLPVEAFKAEDGNKGRKAISPATVRTLRIAFNGAEISFNSQDPEQSAVKVLKSLMAGGVV